MASIEQSIEIERPPEEVYAYLEGSAISCIRLARKQARNEIPRDHAKLKEILESRRD